MKGTISKMVNFQVFPDSAHHAELERHQDQIKLDYTNTYHGAHGRLSFDLHDKNGIPLIEMNIPPK